MKYLVPFFLYFLFTIKVFSQNWFEYQKVTSPTRTEYDGFGISISKFDNTLLIGATGNDYDEDEMNFKSNSGAVYIFEENTEGQLNFIQKITSSDRDAGDNFGHTSCVSGNYAVVSSIYEDHNVIGTDSFPSAGAVYVFEKDTFGVWNEVQKIVANDRQPNDLFGSSITMDENYIFIGAAGDWHYPLYYNAGSVYIFKKNNNGTWVQVQKLIANDHQSGAYFGRAIDLWEDYLAVGAPLESFGGYSENGAVYIFKRDSTETFIQKQKIGQNDAYWGSNFGSSIDINKNELLVGAPTKDHWTEDSIRMHYCGAAYLFERNSENLWIQKQKFLASDYGPVATFGNHVSLGDSDLIIGSRFKSDSVVLEEGAVYAFRKSTTNGNWSEIKKITSSDIDYFDRFGTRVLISGSSAFVGVTFEDEDENGNNTLPGSGSLYCFKLLHEIVGVNELTLGNELIIYPNPNGGRFSVKIPISINEGSISVWNLLGQKQFTLNFDDSNLLNLDLKELENGIYFIELISKKIKIVESFIVSK